MIQIAIKEKDKRAQTIHESIKIPLCLSFIISNYAQETIKEVRERRQAQSHKRHVFARSLCLVWSITIMWLGVGYALSLQKWKEHIPLLYHEQRLVPLSKGGFSASSLLRLSYDSSVLDVYALPSSHEYNTSLSSVIQREQIMFSDSTFQYDVELMKGSQITARTTCDVGRSAVSFCYESAGDENCQNGYGTMSWSLTSNQNNQNIYFRWEALSSTYCRKKTYCPRILPECVIDVEYQLIQFQFPFATGFSSPTVVDVSNVHWLLLRSKTTSTHAEFSSRFEMGLFYRPELYFGVFTILLLICGGCCSYFFAYYRKTS